MPDNNNENDDFWVSHGGVLRVRQLVRGYDVSEQSDQWPGAVQEVEAAMSEQVMPLTLAERPLLLVEDNPDDEMLTLRALEKNAIPNPVIVAHDGVEALDYLFGRGPHVGRNLDVMPAMILLDLNLPRVDGLEVLREIRANRRTHLLPVVVLTTSKEQQDIERAYVCGANSYIRKQVDFERLLATISQIGLYWLTLNEPPKLPLID